MVLTITVSLSQTKVVGSVQINVSSKDIFSQYYVFPRYKSFIILNSDGKFDSKLDRSIFFENYDVNMKSIAKEEFKMGKGFSLMYQSTLSNDSSFYQVYENNKNDLFKFLKYDFVANKLIVNEVQLPKNSWRCIKDKEYIGDKVYFSYKSPKSLAVMIYNFTTGNFFSKELKEFNPKLNSASIQTLIDNRGQKEIVAHATQLAVSNELVIFRFDENGNPKSSPIVLPKIPATARLKSSLSVLKDGSLFITGTYSQSLMGFSNGIFVTKIKPSGEIEYDNLINYLDFPSFTSFLPQNEQDKLEQKKIKKESNGKELTVNYNAKIQDLLQIQGKNYLITEFYEDEYKFVTYHTSNGTSTDKQNDGFRITHANIACLDDKGKMVWSNTFVVDYKMYLLNTKYVNLKLENDKLVVNFKDKKNSIEAKYTLAGKKIDEVKMPLRDEEGKIVVDTEEKYQKWYDKYFLKAHYEYNEKSYLFKVEKSTF